MIWKLRKEKEFEEEHGSRKESNHEKGSWLQVKNQHLSNFHQDLGAI